MSVDSAQPQVEKRKSPFKRVLVFLFILLLLAGGGYLFYELMGKQILLDQKTESYLKEARSFIENRKFDYAEASIEEVRKIAPNNVEVDRLEDELRSVRYIDLREKELTASLQAKDWIATQKAVNHLRDRDSDHPMIQLAIDDMKVGKHQDRLIKLQDYLAEAQRNNNLKDQISFTDQLTQHDPENPIAVRWKEINQKAKDEINESEKKAKLFYEQALLVDNGIYSNELNTLALKAKTLSSKGIYKAFYDKVSKYPRLIRYPNEYSNLQDAINVARPIDTIIVSEGAFHAPIQINKEIKLQAQEGKTVVLHSIGKDSPVIHVTEKGRLFAKNISIKHVDKGETEAAYSTIVVEGEANLESCVIFQSVAHGVHVVNSGKFIAKSCRVEGNRWSGIVASGEKSVASLTESVIIRNGHNGIDAWESGLIEMFSSKSEENGQSGASATNYGSIKVVGSTISKNKHTGLYLSESGNANLKESELSNNLLAGGYGDRSGNVTLLDVKVMGNSIAGLVLTKGTTWNGVNTATFIENSGQDIWKDAEFRISEILKNVTLDEEVERESADGVGSSTTTEEETEPARAVIVEESPKGEE